MSKFNLKVPEDQLKKLNKGLAFRAGVLKGVRAAMLFSEGEAKRSFGRPGNLKVRTGNLRRSIRSNVRQVGDMIEGSIGSNVVYAAIHEFGGRAGRNLASKIPARPYLEPAITDNLIEINRIIKKAIKEEVKKHAR